MESPTPKPIIVADGGCSELIRKVAGTVDVKAGTEAEGEGEKEGGVGKGVGAGMDQELELV